MKPSDIKAWKKLARVEKTWKKFKSHFTKAIINGNKSDTGTLKAIGIDNAVKEQVNQNKENQQIPAQATVEANDKIVQLEKQQAQLYIYTVLLVKHPQPQQNPIGFHCSNNQSTNWQNQITWRWRKQRWNNKKAGGEFP